MVRGLQGLTFRLGTLKRRLFPPPFEPEVVPAIEQNVRPGPRASILVPTSAGLPVSWLQPSGKPDESSPSRLIRRMPTPYARPLPPRVSAG